MIMAHVSVGEMHEKMGDFRSAMKYYREGKDFSETNFGREHPLYDKCSNYMGNARLKLKKQTKREVEQREQFDEQNT